MTFCRLRPAAWVPALFWIRPAPPRVNAGINATSSNYTFNVQATPGINPLNVASSSGSSLFNVDAFGTVNIGSLQAPGPLTLTDGGVGGSRSGNTFYYVVTAVDGGGHESLPSPENSITVGFSHIVIVSWAAAPGAASYRVYRGGSGSGSESLYLTTSDTYLKDISNNGAGGTPPVSGNGVMASFGSNGADFLGGSTNSQSLLIAANASSTNLFPVLQLGGANLNSSSTNGTYLGLNSPVSF